MAKKTKTAVPLVVLLPRDGSFNCTLANKCSSFHPIYQHPGHLSPTEQEVSILVNLLGNCQVSEASGTLVGAAVCFGSKSSTVPSLVCRAVLLCE